MDGAPAASTSDPRDPAGPGPGAPNVVLIVLDDTGFADLGCFGSRIATPNIDALAQGGLRYNQYHVTALCSPTRACLLTGRNQHTVGMGFVADLAMPYPGYTGRLPKSAAMLPRLLRDAGYNTFATGKWHLVPTSETGPTGPFDRWPLGMGFEHFYGFTGGLTDQWRPALARDNTLIPAPASPEDGYHVTEDLADQAIRFVDDQQHAAPERPFFLYFATGAMHWPHQVAPAWSEPYRGRFDDGWEAMREEVFARQKQLGVVPASARLTPRPSWVSSWDRFSAEERRLYARMMEVYAGFLTHTDAQIGRVLDFLSAHGVLDNTIVMVSSDNGASAEGGPHGFFSEMGRDDVESMLGHVDEFGGDRTHNHYAWGWAWAGNTPFQLWKRYSWLGGVRVPLVVHWPAGIPAGDHGEVRGQFCHAIDVMPTILEAAGVEVPETVDGSRQVPLDGASILSTFTDSSCPSPRSTQYFETAGSRAIYHEGWKATTNHVDITMPAERELIEGSHDFEDDRWSLFDLSEDFSEVDDLAEAQPERLQQMIDLWNAEARRNDVLPLTCGLISPERFEAVVRHVRDRYVYVAGGGPIVTPSPFLGFDLRAEVEMPDGDVHGLICAHHNYLQGWGMTRPGGWTCHVADGRLVVAVSYHGEDPQRIAVDMPSEVGRHEVGIGCLPAGDGDTGALTLSVSFDGREVSRETISPAQPEDHLVPWHFFDGKLLFGGELDGSLSEVTAPFTGRIHRAVLTVPRPEAPAPNRETIETALREE